MGGSAFRRLSKAKPFPHPRTVQRGHCHQETSFGTLPHGRNCMVCAKSETEMVQYREGSYRRWPRGGDIVIIYRWPRLMVVSWHKLKLARYICDKTIQGLGCEGYTQGGKPSRWHVDLSFTRGLRASDLSKNVFYHDVKALE